MNTPPTNPKPANVYFELGAAFISFGIAIKIAMICCGLATFTLIALLRSFGLL